MSIESLRVLEEAKKAFENLTELEEMKKAVEKLIEGEKEKMNDDLKRIFSEQEENKKQEAQKKCQ